jgi:cbb3-type cytochrome oxidase subunit 3
MEKFLETFANYAPIIGLFIFFGIFVGVVIWAMRPSKKQELQALANIPLMDDNMMDIVEKNHG